MLMIYEDERQYENQELLAEMVARHRAFVGELGEVFKSGSGLGGSDSATIVRTGADGAKTIHDGPFAEAREQLGGYYVVDVADLDAALAIARRIPLRSTGAIEVRPMMG
jgi:hypothetical protein